MVTTDSGLADGDQQSFWLWKRAIEQRTGVRITPDRERALANLLHSRMRALNCHDIRQYFADSLDDAKGAKEWSKLVDSLLIKETSFFRHQPSLDYVERWVKSMSRGRGDKTPIWVWSLGCSSGEEPYSLAIVIQQVMERHDRVTNFGIVATDISRDAIANARHGVYSGGKLNALSSQTKAKYFDQVGADSFRVVDRLRSHICFLNSNILTDKSPLIRRKMDLIYCQNMLVYFRRWQRREIVNKLIAHMQDDGHMLLGLGELGAWVPQGLHRAVPRTVQAYTKQSAIVPAKTSTAQVFDKASAEHAIRRC